MEVVAKLPSTDQRDNELKQVLKALGAFRRGESGVTLPTEWDGVYGKIAAEFNELTAQTARTSHKLKAVDTAARGTARIRRVSDEKLTGFWQNDVAVVNSVLDEVESLSEHTRSVPRRPDRPEEGQRFSPACRRTGPASSARSRTHSMTWWRRTCACRMNWRACPAWSARKASSRSGPSCPMPAVSGAIRAESHQLADRRPGAPDVRSGARDRRGGPGRPVQDHGAGSRRQAAGRRIPAHRHDHQQDGAAAGHLLRRSDAGGARSGHRRQAGRPGRRARRGRHLEGPDRLRELHGRRTSRPRCATSPT